jgi:ATP phosphoribosyltransferase regulatory subunit HisZ
MMTPQTIPYPQWLDYLEHFLEVNPEAQSKELFRRFPELRGSEDVLDAAYAHIMALKNEGLSLVDLRTMFPELYRPKMNWWHKIIQWMRKT